MKKTYMQPATLLTTVAMEQMVCTSPASPTSGFQFNNDGTGSGSTSGEGAVSEGMSRGNFWDDEE